MSRYSTGELAKLCGVTVRTVQYYDREDVVKPSELTEGGRRVYTDDDLRRMKLVCALRELGLKLSVIREILCEANSREVIRTLLHEQECELTAELAEAKEKLSRLKELTRELDAAEDGEALSDIAGRMGNRKKLQRLYRIIIIGGIAVDALLVVSIQLWVSSGLWWLFVLAAVVSAAVVTWLVRLYYRKVDYVCPDCHATFKPSMREFFWAAHTPKTRRLTCTVCGHKSFCTETLAVGEAEQAAE